MVLENRLSLSFARMGTHDEEDHHKAILFIDLFVPFRGQQLNQADETDIVISRRACHHICSPRKGTEPSEL